MDKENIISVDIDDRNARFVSSIHNDNINNTNTSSNSYNGRNNRSSNDCCVGDMYTSNNSYISCSTGATQRNIKFTSVPRSVETVSTPNTITDITFTPTSHHSSMSIDDNINSNKRHTISANKLHTSITQNSMIDKSGSNDKRDRNAKMSESLNSFHDSVNTNAEEQRDVSLTAAMKLEELKEIPSTLKKSQVIVSINTKEHNVEKIA